MKRIGGLLQYQLHVLLEVFDLEQSVSCTRGTYCHNCMMENPRTQISELHVDIFRDTADYQCWKVNFKRLMYAPTLDVLQSQIEDNV